MRVVVVQRHGGPEVLVVGDREAPRSGPDQLLVDIAAAGVNSMDICQREGRAYGEEPPYIPGAVGAGGVPALGPDVSEFEVGDRVAWSNVIGSYAAKVIIPVARAVPVPMDIDLQLAAAVMLQGLTAH